MTSDKILNYDYYSTTGIYIFIIPKVGATVYIVCSESVAHDILKLPERCAKMTNRIILALRISEIIFSTITHLFGTCIVPQGLVYGSSGNKEKCTVPGFLIVISSVGGDFYNITLALAYLLQVRNGQKE